MEFIIFFFFFWHLQLILEDNSKVLSDDDICEIEDDYQTVNEPKGCVQQRILVNV